MTQRSARAKTVGERLRQPTEVRRRLIVSAARAVIAERGLSATTMRDIARAGEVSLGTLTYHFTGIAEILTEVLTEETTGYYDVRAGAARDAPDAMTAMGLLIDPLFGDDERTLQHWRLWLDFWASSAHDAAQAEWQASVYARWRADVTAVLQRGAASGEFQVEDVDTLVVEFMALVDGLAAHAFLPGSTVRPAAARAHLHGWVRRSLRPTPRSPT